MVKMDGLTFTSTDRRRPWELEAHLACSTVAGPPAIWSLTCPGAPTQASSAGEGGDVRCNQWMVVEVDPVDQFCNGCACCELHAGCLTGPGVPSCVLRPSLPQQHPRRRPPCVKGQMQAVEGRDGGLRRLALHQLGMLQAASLVPHPSRRPHAGVLSR